MIVFIVLLLFFDLSKGEIYLTILSNLVVVVVIGFVVEYDFFWLSSSSSSILETAKCLFKGAVVLFLPHS